MDWEPSNAWKPTGQILGHVSRERRLLYLKLVCTLKMYRGKKCRSVFHQELWTTASESWCGMGIGPFSEGCLERQRVSRWLEVPPDIQGLRKEM